MTTKELKALNKAISDIKKEIKELNFNYKNGVELDGEKMLENEYNIAICDLVDKLEEAQENLKNKVEGN